MVHGYGFVVQDVKGRAGGRGVHVAWGQEAGWAVERVGWVQVLGEGCGGLRRGQRTSRGPEGRKWFGGCKEVGGCRVSEKDTAGRAGGRGPVRVGGGRRAQ